jgi:hypothetical protein
MLQIKAMGIKECSWLLFFGGEVLQELRLPGLGSIKKFRKEGDEGRNGFSPHCSLR